MPRTMMRVGTWCSLFSSFIFFFNDTATTEIYTLSLHDALPISGPTCCRPASRCADRRVPSGPGDRKSTRLNSSHTVTSYAVFCLKKKKNTIGRSNQNENPKVNSALDNTTHTE